MLEHLDLLEHQELTAHLEILEHQERKDPLDFPV
jgi:hypothetical protein